MVDAFQGGGGFSRGVDPFDLFKDVFGGGAGGGGGFGSIFDDFLEVQPVEVRLKAAEDRTCA